MISVYVSVRYTLLPPPTHTSPYQPPATAVVVTADAAIGVICYNANVLQASNTHAQTAPGSFTYCEARHTKRSVNKILLHVYFNWFYHELCEFFLFYSFSFILCVSVCPAAAAVIALPRAERSLVYALHFVVVVAVALTCDRTPCTSIPNAKCIWTVGQRKPMRGAKANSLFCRRMPAAAVRVFGVCVQ